MLLIGRCIQRGYISCRSGEFSIDILLLMARMFVIFINYVYSLRLRSVVITAWVSEQRVGASIKNVCIDA